MIKESALYLYLCDVLGVTHPFLLPIAQKKNNFTLKTQKKVALVMLAPSELAKNEQKLLKKMAQACPLQPVEILQINPLWGCNEIEKRVEQLAPQKVMVFGEELFHVVKGHDEPFFNFINQSFPFAGAQVYSSHDLKDLTQGPHVQMLKKQVWQQMKQLTQS